MNAMPERRITEPAGPPMPLFGQEANHVPERIGPFRILAVVGCGGNAIVYKAEQEVPRRTVALKMPHGGQLASQEARARFRREIELAASFEHSAVVPVFEVGDVLGAPYYTMPFIEGRNIEDHVRQENVNQTAKLALLLRLCDALEALHRRGLVHRDVKPENVMVDRYGEIRLLDFGLARAMAGDHERLTGAPVLMGTPPFMAPEQLACGPGDGIGPAADVHALGVMLYGFLCDAYPFEADGTPKGMCEAIRNETPPPPSQIRPAFGTVFDALVADCLAKDPAARPPTAGALAVRLRAVMEGRLDGRNASLPLPAPVPAGLTGRRTWLSRRVLLVALFALGLLLVYALYRRGPRPDAGDADVPAPPTGTPEYPSTEVTPPAPHATLLPSPGDLPPELLVAGVLHPELDATWNRVIAALRTFEHRNDGALLLRALAPGSLRWETPNGVQNRRLDAGGETVLFAPGDQPFLLEWRPNGSSSQMFRSIPRAGQAIYSELPAHALYPTQP